MNNLVNLAVQVLTLHQSQEDAYKIVDVAIACIESSGLKYAVCPFETVVEGPYEQVMKLLDSIQEACKTAGASSLLVNMKLQRSFEKDIYIDDKIGKYK